MARDGATAAPMREPVLEPQPKLPGNPEQRDVEANTANAAIPGKPGLSFGIPGTDTVVRP